MAVEISNGTSVPHATDYQDLLAKLVIFATANGWALTESTSDKVVLTGEGLSGGDAIHVAFQKYSDVGTDAFGWYLNGYTGYQSGLSFIQQPGAIPASYPALPLWNSAIPYWFIVSARRIIVVAKISTTYQVAYMGYMLPYGTPGQYPYPLVIGGSANDTRPRWSATGNNATAPFIPYTNTPSVLYVRLLSGQWYQPRISIMNAGGFAGEGTWPYNCAVHGSTYPIALLRPALSGEYTLQPIVICHRASSTDAALLGDFDGAKHITGADNAAENTITIGGDTWLVVQNVYRTSTGNYFAIRLA